MLTLQQSLFAKGNAGDPLPVVWKSLAQRGTRFLRGQLCLICAGPGTGKSAFVLTYALKARVPTLYFSADSDAFTQLSRSASILTGWSMERTADEILRGRLSAELSAALADIPIRFNYLASPTADQIKLSLESYAEVYGDYPALVVVDNITNVRASVDAEDPFEGLESLMDWLHKLARESGACIIGLHHVTGGYNDADKPIPLSGVKGQISRVPELILTLNRVSSEFGPDVLNVSTVKNRAARADPSGQSFVSLEWLGDTMQIRDFASGA